MDSWSGPMSRQLAECCEMDEAILGLRDRWSDSGADVVLGVRTTTCCAMKEVTRAAADRSLQDGHGRQGWCFTEELRLIRS